MKRIGILTAGGDTPALNASFDLGQNRQLCDAGYATAVFVLGSGVERIRTTAESHRRIEIIYMMGRHSAYIVLGSVSVARHHSDSGARA